MFVTHISLSDPECGQIGIVTPACVVSLSEHWREEVGSRESLTQTEHWMSPEEVPTQEKKLQTLNMTWMWTCVHNPLIQNTPLIHKHPTSHTEAECAI
jgi:hypothetical protein